MVINPIHRNFLCLLMTNFPRQYFQTNKNDEDKKQLLEIVAEHLESPNLDLSGYLASEQLSREQLIKLPKHVQPHQKQCKMVFGQ